MTPAPNSILLVCMGNICRSPTAEGVLRAKLDAAGLAKRLRVDSAGTHGYHAGEAPDPRAVRHAAARGYDLARLRARKVEREDFSRFDWILAMDEDNLARLRQIAPDDARADLGLLMEHALQHAVVREVPDPYYGSAAGFERVLDLVEDACDGIVARLLRAQST
ncbi:MULTISPECIES: low molecular weight protein-tyrosine-phosphatase [unclassified Rubrivivax]|uniref:low molecular weight protein-tyrosine-phosphatase n=1 Tax=unclassified Rubrivivax TaxID=2649762 RepID=UPI001E44B727|nr:MULTISPECIES: low molecular weight protein-tyrosine-phosphatase [unclassified Rubrivivax]MCC9596033.1 low molecular weight phosphotyrosine protein phosphatase [Rubrivivax sp. JA1055]MCC9647626.1 low molecular weight phosphotyrosine protein phosphatase [Rubrivivax sp. JA1029]